MRISAGLVHLIVNFINLLTSQFSLSLSFLLFANYRHTCPGHDIKLCPAVPPLLASLGGLAAGRASGYKNLPHTPDVGFSICLCPSHNSEARQAGRDKYTLGDVI